MFKKLIEATEKVRGGLSDDMTIDKIAEKHGVGIRTIEMQIEKGKKIEMEHTDDPEEAEKVAMDHLVEIPDYYDRLHKMEKEAEEELNEAMILLTEDEKEISKELTNVRKFFGGEKIPGIDTNRFVRIWNTISANLKMNVKVFVKLLNPMNWPKAVFMNFYDIIKGLATLGTHEQDGLKLEVSKFMKEIADGKYRGKSASVLFTDYNDMRKKYGFKPYTFLQENVIRTDFNGELNRDFDGNVIDSLLEMEIRNNILDKFTSKVVLNINSLPDSESYIFEIESNDNINPNDSIEIYAVIEPRLKEILPLSRIFNTEKAGFNKEFNSVIRTWFERCWNLSNKSKKKYSLRWHNFESISEAVASKGTLMKNARAIQAKLRTTTDPEEIRKMIEQLESITKVLENPDLTNAKVSMRKGKVVEK